MKNIHQDSEAEVRSLLLTTLKYSYQVDEWVPTLLETLEGVSASKAAERPAPGSKGIWDITLHLAVWNENMIERIETGEKAHPKEGNWPELPAELTQEAWDQCVSRAVKSSDELFSYLQTATLDKLRSSPWGLEDIACRFLHNAYHIGQIVKIREINGW